MRGSPSFRQPPMYINVAVISLRDRLGWLSCCMLFGDPRIDSRSMLRNCVACHHWWSYMEISGMDPTRIAHGVTFFVSKI